MEMQRHEFPSASMSGSAESNEPEMISPTSTLPSSSLRSPQTDSSIISGVVSSPAYSPPRPPSLPPLQPQADPHCIIAIPSLPAIPQTARPMPSPYITKEEALKSISESSPHTIWLEKLQKSDRDHQKNVAKSKKAARRKRKEIYEIVSIYALMLGAIFSAVAQSSTFTCEDWWGPASIVGAVTFATWLRTLEKLHGMHKHRQDAKRYESCRDAVYDKIMLMFWKGSFCEIESLEPQHKAVFKDEPCSMCVFSARGVLVLGFLLGFSALMMVSCRQMLMDRCGHQ